MTGIHDLPLFIAAGLLLNVTPGPDMAYMAARSASGGFRAGAAAVLGTTTGCFVHTLAAAFVPQFIDPDAPAKALAFTLLGALFNFDSLFVNLPVAWLASRSAQRLRDGATARLILQRVTGSLFVLLAARLAWSPRT